MVELRKILKEEGKYRITAIEYKMDDSGQHAGLYAVDKFKILNITKKEIEYEYERKIIFDNNEDYCIKVSVIGIQPHSKSIENGTFEKYNEQQILEEVDEVLKDLPAKASLIVSNLFSFAFSTTVITPPKFLRNKFKL